MCEETMGAGRQDEIVRPVFTRADLLNVKLRREWVELWDGKWGCVFEPTVSQKAAAQRCAMINGQWDQGRFGLELFVDCVRDGESDDAKAIFGRKDDWQALQGVGDGPIQRVVNTALRLNGLFNASQEEALKDFFGMTPQGEDGESPPFSA